MFERSDGLLLNITKDPDTNATRITSFSTADGVLGEAALLAPDLEQLFCHDVELMNPNNTTRRHAYLAERVHADGGNITINKSPSIALVPAEHHPDFHLPMGKMSQSERERLHRGVISTETRRNEKIAAIERNRMERFQKRLLGLREKHRIEKDNARKLLQLEMDRMIADKQQKEFQEKNEQAKRIELDKLRCSRLHEKKFEIRVRDESAIKKIMDEKAASISSREVLLEQWKAKKAETVLRTKAEQAEFYSAMTKLDEKRQEEHDRKQLRWWHKETERLKERAAWISAKERKNIVNIERRKARAHELFSSKPIPV
jgi:hypothetical protein